MVAVGSRKSMSVVNFLPYGLYDAENILPLNVIFIHYNDYLRIRESPMYAPLCGVTSFRI